MWIDISEDEVKMMKKPSQGVVSDDRGQTQPADKKRAQQSQMEGPAAYAPHDLESEKIRPKRPSVQKREPR